MTQQRAGIEREERSDNDNRARRPLPVLPQTPVEAKKPGLRRRWNSVQTSKTMVFWLMLGVIALTIFIGFRWGGWVTSASAQSTANNAAQSAVVTRLAPMCLAHLNMDPQKVTKLVELQATSSYQRSAYVKAQGWATMPGETTPDNKVAEACARLLVE
jgi:hypothetical protein